MAREYVLLYTVNGNAMRAGKMLNSEQDARDWALSYAESNQGIITELYFLGEESGEKFVLDPLGEPVDADFEEVEESADVSAGTTSENLESSTSDASEPVDAPNKEEK